PSNPLQLGFICSIGEKISNIQDTPSATINIFYNKVFETQTEHSVLKIEYSLQKDLLYASSSYISSLMSYHEDKNEIQQFVGKTPIDVWKKYGMYQNKDHFVLFGLKDPKV
ncbi:903_t:CDS:2, partial [Scutellospora calospora]